MTKQLTRIAVVLAAAAAITFAVRFRPAPALVRAPDAASPGPTSTTAATDLPSPDARPANLPEKDLAIAERTLNDSGMVTVDERLVQPLHLPLFAPGRKVLSPFAMVALDLNAEESAAVVSIFGEAEINLHEEMNARARITPVMDGVRLAYHLDPAEIAAREDQLRTRIAAALDPASQRFLQKIAPGALVTALLPVPLEDVTVTITRNEKAEYRAEMAGRDSGGNTSTSWRVVRANALLTEFYGDQAREHLPQFDADLVDLRSRRTAQPAPGR